MCGPDIDVITMISNPPRVRFLPPEGGNVPFEACEVCAHSIAKHLPRKGDARFFTRR